MKVLHICLAAFYVDNYSYQENILPRMHKELGYEVKIVASTETYVDKLKLGYVQPSQYINSDGIQVSRIPYVKWIPKVLVHKLRVYKNLKSELMSFSPDVIFLHDAQFISIKTICNYLKKNNNVRVYVDSHTDYINSANGFFSKQILHKIIYRKCLKKIDPFTIKFYGTLPVRCDFLHDVYKIPIEKIEFLPMGADDLFVDKYNNKEISKIEREKYGLSLDDIVLVTGGKIDRNKSEVLDLMRVINDYGKKLKLLVFGSVDKELIDDFNNLCCDNVIYLGWANNEDSYRFFSIADCVIFPSTHSVYWEQAVGLGKPILVRKWEKIDHLDFGGNLIYIEKGDYESIKEAIDLLLNENTLEEMTKKANEVSVNFRYKNIALHCIKE